MAVLRQCQWVLDDVAHDPPAGRVTPEKCIELAELLEQVARLARTYGPTIVERGE